jgi:methylglutaconyl-CoA hydratase
MTSVLDSFPSDVPDLPDLVSLERDGELVWLTIERPEVMNCLSFPTLRRFRQLLEQLRDDLTIRALLITGRGEKSFCTGADLKERKEMPPERARKHVGQIKALTCDLEAMPQPTIAVINGFAFGGGLELALSCDLRIAAAHATMGLTETSLAIIPGAGGTQRLPRLVGRARAKDLILTARRLAPEEAERIGLIDRVAPEGGVRQAALELASLIASRGPIAIRAAKAAIDGGIALPLAQALDHEWTCYERVLDTADRLEALAAFSEKRAPRFEGR